MNELLEELLAEFRDTAHLGRVTVRLLVAALLGGVVGLERLRDGRAAGLRTHMLVSLGSALFAMIGAYGFQDFASARTDPSRIAAQNSHTSA